uniref:TSA: Wollemia nobilis Ref_Wollemi_Transcript_2321_2433 transcribed RNA sequence n=1 Tax=Wollemia nobilis TaxID=56998 RepID=A0A0C9RYT9_9CONI
MMSAEGDLMLAYSDNLLQGGDFGELDRVMLTGDLFEGMTVPQLDFEGGDLFGDRTPYDDKTPWTGDTQKQEVVLPIETEENRSTTRKMHHLSLDSLEETPFVQFTEAKIEPEQSILMGYPSSNGCTSSYPSVSYTPSIVSPTAQLATSFSQASLVSSRISLPNGQINLSNGQISVPNGQLSLPNCLPQILTSSVANELVLDDNENFSSSIQFSSTPRTSSSIELANFVSKADATGDSLSPLPTYIHKPSMMQRSFSSHSLDQLRVTPRVHETNYYPQFSPMYPSVQELSSPDSRLQPQLSDLQGMNTRPAFKSMRRVYSTGDIQTINGIQMSHGSASPLTSEIEEAGFKIGRYSAEERKERIHRYRKKRSERNFNKKIKYACRKTLADSRPRIRGRFARNEDAGDMLTSSHHDEDDEDEVDALQEDDEDFMLGNNTAIHQPREMINISTLHMNNGYPFGFKY